MAKVGEIALVCGVAICGKKTGHGKGTMGQNWADHCFGNRFVLSAVFALVVPTVGQKALNRLRFERRFFIY